MDQFYNKVTNATDNLRAKILQTSTDVHCTGPLISRTINILTSWPPQNNVNLNLSERIQAQITVWRVLQTYRWQWARETATFIADRFQHAARIILDTKGTERALHSISRYNYKRETYWAKERNMLQLTYINDERKVFFMWCISLKTLCQNLYHIVALQRTLTAVEYYIKHAFYEIGILMPELTDAVFFLSFLAVV